MQYVFATVVMGGLFQITANIFLMPFFSTAIMVPGIAAGPPVLGYLLDIHFSISHVMLSAALLTMVVFLVSLLMNVNRTS